MSTPLPVPPSWKDLGKSSGDLLGKDFPINGTFLEVKTTTPASVTTTRGTYLDAETISASNVTFKVNGFRDGHTAHVSGDLEGKYTDPKNGVTLTQGWTTSNTLKTVLELDGQLANGVKIEVGGTAQPDKGHHHAHLGFTVKQPGVHTRGVLDVFKGPTFTADTVLGRDGFLIGGEASYNVQDGTIHKYAAAVGYSGADYAVTLHGLGNLSTFSASYYHRVSKDVEAGAKAIYDSKATTKGVSMEVGAKAYLDPASYVKAKINSESVVVLSYVQALRPGVKATFGIALDTAKLNSSGGGTATHKVGASFTFES